MKEAILSYTYLPSFAWMSVFLNAETITIERQETFQKQTFRNRTRILTSQGIQELTVPVNKPSHNPLITEVLVDNSQPWQKTHWRAIQSAYGSSPYFEYYADEFKFIYETKWQKLFELNEMVLTVCLNALGAKKAFSYSQEYVKEVDNEVFDGRKILTDTHHNHFTENLVYNEYIQVFGSVFVKNLSIVDLVFNTGPQANQMLYNSLESSETKKLNNKLT